MHKWEVGTWITDFHCAEVGNPSADFQKNLYTKKEKEVGIRDADFHCSKVGIPYADFKRKIVFLYISEVGIPDADFTVHLPLHVICSEDSSGAADGGASWRRTAPAAWPPDLAP